VRDSPQHEHRSLHHGDHRSPRGRRFLRPGSRHQSESVMFSLKPLALALAGVFLYLAPAHAKVFELQPESERRALTRFELRDLGGKRFRSTEATGKVMVMSFWATWCAPCKQELTSLTELKQKASYGDALLLLGINTDGPET